IMDKTGTITTGKFAVARLAPTTGVDGAELLAAAAAAGIPGTTLERAKGSLGVESHRAWDRAANRGEWYWADPSAPWPATAPVKQPFRLPPLDGG
ncbi:MAG: hypothetical protein K2P78_01355, partial [Gemmataceae bacterium]|nr:hypothetical protein [Gemmataceae bacterium]